jgi:Flp pilus assembly protein TadD
LIVFCAFCAFWCIPASYAQTPASLEEATALLQARRFAEAEAATRKVLATKPRSADAHALLALILDQRGQEVEAEREYQTALRLKPNLVSALSNFGVLLARTNRPADAIAKFEEVLRIDPKHERAIFNLGALYAARGDYKRAVPLLEKAAGSPACKTGTREPSDRALLLTLVNAYVHVDRRQEALALSRCLEETSAGDARALFTLALSLAEAHEYAEAVRLFQRTNELRPRTYEVLDNLGLALYNLDRLAEAQEALSSASTLASGEADPLYRLGLVASAQNDTKAALTHWSKALELRPVFPEVNFMIGEELLKNRLAEKSIPFYERALEQSKGQLVYYLRLGVANVRGQRYPQAREIFTRALEKYPDNSNLYFLLGYAARAEGQYDQAVTAFQKVLQLQPDNPDAHSNLGYIASQRGQHVEAERLLRRAIQLDPQSFPSYHDLGRLLVKLKRYDEAVPLLQRGVELNDKDPGIRYQLFLAYSRLKRKDEAEKELAEFKRLDEGSRHGATPLSDAVKSGSGMDADVLPPLPAAASGDSAKPRTP